MLTLKLSLVISLIAASTCFRAADGASLRIIGGIEASPGEFPFLVSIQMITGNEKVEHNCGGALFTLSKVITAAHCVHHYTTEQLQVVAGAHYFQDVERGIQQKRNVKNKFEHYAYDPIKNRTFNDIAILDLDYPFQEDANVSTLALAPRHQLSSGQCEIIGWGATGPGNLLSDVLRKGAVDILNKQICKDSYPEEYDEETQLCAGKMEGDIVDTCFGDTGGPIVCKKEHGEAYLAGVSSWGSGCGGGVLRKPGVYMEISKYRTWIESVVWGGPGTTTGTSAPPTEAPEMEIPQEDEIINKKPCGTVK